MPGMMRVGRRRRRRSCGRCRRRGHLACSSACARHAAVTATPRRGSFPAPPPRARRRPSKRVYWEAPRKANKLRYLPGRFGRVGPRTCPAPTARSRGVTRRRGTGTRCRVLEVSTSGYYAWLVRPASSRATADATLSDQIRAAHQRSRGTYGERRVHAELAALGVAVGLKRIARLMRVMGLQGVSRRKRGQTTIRSHDAAAAPDLVARDFTATASDQLWVADITYIPTWAGFLYLAVVLDALEPAHRRLGDGDASAHRARASGPRHGDHPAPAARGDPSFGPRLPIHVVRLRAPLPGDGRASIDGLRRRRVRQCDVRELLRDARVRAARPAPLKTQVEARLAVFEFIEGWYNPHRRHSALNYQSPLNYERGQALAS